MDDHNGKSEFLRKKKIEAIAMVLRNHCSLSEILVDLERLCLKLPLASAVALASSVSRAERMLIRIALDIWDESGNVNVDELMSELSEDDFTAAIDGLKHYWNTP